LAGGGGGHESAMSDDRRLDDTQPGDPSARSEPLDLDDGPDVTIDQQPTGPGNELGGGEFPDRDTPPSSAAQGTTDREPRPDVRQAVDDTYGTTEDRARAADEK
jgi:hypothetical protein